MDKIEFNTFDPFAQDGDDDIGIVQDIHIRVQQRNNKKCWTNVSGLYKELNLKKIMKSIKKTLGCNANIEKVYNKDGLEDEEGNEIYTEVLRFQGDHREEIKSFLIKNEIATEEDINVHGY
jgi:translation initiation factor 1